MLVDQADFHLKGDKLKYLSMIAVAALVTGCATEPMGTHAVGESARAPSEVAQCVAQKWADGSQQQTTLQHVTADNKSFAVYAPGHTQADGGEAIIRPAMKGSGSWVGYRPAHGASEGDSTTVSTIKECL